MLLVRGRMTYPEAPELREGIFGQLSNPKLSALIVDLGQVQKIDTAGVAVLLEGLLASRDRSLRMILCDPSESVREIFRLAGFHDLLAACSSHEELQRELMA